MGPDLGVAVVGTIGVVLVGFMTAFTNWMNNRGKPTAEGESSGGIRGVLQSIGVIGTDTAVRDEGLRVMITQVSRQLDILGERQTETNVLLKDIRDERR